MTFGVLKAHEKKKSTPNDSPKEPTGADLRDRGTSGRPRRKRSIPSRVFVLKAKTTRRSVCFYINVAVYSRQTLGSRRSTSLAKVTFGCGPMQFSRGNATRHKVGTRGNPKAFHHNNPQGRRQEEAFGREELSSWNPNDAQSPSDGVWTIQLNGWNAPAPEGLCG
jgi:hypothetical protein